MNRSPFEAFSALTPAEIEAGALGAGLFREADGVVHRHFRWMPTGPATAVAISPSAWQLCREESLRPGEGLPDEREAARVGVPLSRFRREWGGRVLHPGTGRFFPLAVLDTDGLSLPPGRVFRIVGGSAPDSLQLDFSHPMAEKSCTLQVWCSDPASREAVAPEAIRRFALQDGPGMQERWHGVPTDFGPSEAFQRADSAPDREFYSQPRLVHHIDGRAAAWIRYLHRSVIPPRARVLDLMSSWVTHLDADLPVQSVCGLGMNAAELDANPRLDEQVVQDLNRSPVLPFGNGEFDAVICALSIEYLVDPVAIFQEVGRVLRPGGIFLVSFTNRWFPTKAIAIWAELHEFERMGLVLEWFHAAGGYRNLATWSLRGGRRPPDDPYAGRLPWSDPVYAVWGVHA